MVDVGANIARLRKRSGLSQEKLAKRIGLSKQAVSNYEMGLREPDQATLRRIARELNVSLGMLLDYDMGDRLALIMAHKGVSAEEASEALGLEPDTIGRAIAGDLKLNDPQVEALAKYLGVTSDCINGFAPYDADIRSDTFPASITPISGLHHQNVPLIGKVAAGQPIMAVEEYDTFVNAPINCDCALEVQGDSMVPTYLPGDIVYIKHRQTVDNGQVAVVLIDDEATLKHVYRDSAGLTLISDNPAFAPIRIDGQEHDYIAIYGIPVGYTRMYRKNYKQE